MDPGRSPQQVFLAHPSDEIAYLMIDLRPPCPISGFPTPEDFETSPMPPQDSFRPSYLGQIAQIGLNPGDPHQQRPAATVQPQTRRRSPQGDVELMTEKQVLGFKPAPRLKHVDDEHSERMHNRKPRQK
jgi:hypothetical protein